MAGLQKALNMCELLLLFLLCGYFHYVLTAHDLFNIDSNDLDKDTEGIFSTL